MLTAAADDRKTHLRPHISRLRLQLVAAFAAVRVRGRTLSMASQTERGLVTAVKGNTEMIMAV